MINRRKLCECGCGAVVNNRFVKGHAARCFSDEVKRKMGESGRKRWGNPKNRARISLAIKMSCNTPEEIKRRSVAAKEMWNRQGYKEKFAKLTSQWQNKPKNKKRMCAIQKEVQNREETKIKHSKTATIVNNNLEKRQQHSQYMKERMNDPEYKKMFIKQCNRPEVKRKHSIKQKNNWKDSEYVKKQMLARNVCKNKAEKKLEKIINKLYPNEYKFVGDGKVVIAGKCPDFINVNGQKKIIELYGDYWHRNDNPEDRKEIFKPFGYDTLIIWEHELKNIRRVGFRINKFHRMEHTL